MHASNINVSRETNAALENYVALLLKWNAKINLIGKTTERDLWERHITDSLQLTPFLPATATSCLDMGSGAGLPGLILAIALPNMAMTLAEQDDRKAAFLREAIRVLGLKNVTVYNGDVGKLQGCFDVVMARAFSSLKHLCGFAAPLIHTDSICLFPKGESYAMELTEAQKIWQFDCQLQPSVTQEQAMIVSISKLKSMKE